MEYLLLVGGIVALVVSGKYLIRGGEEIARHFKISALVVGVTVVAFGTSAPELIVSLSAAVMGHSEIAVGNVLGSNISNIGLVLALTAVIIPIPVKRQSVIFDSPIMLGSFALLYVFLLNGQLDFWEGGIFVLLLAGFMFWSVWHSKRQARHSHEKILAPEMKLIGALALVIGSSVGLAFGANFLVEGASQIARNFGVSERVISVTIIAFGTSVPELTASLMAAFKGETDISIGNIIGSNIFNIFSVLGVTSLIQPIPARLSVFGFDIFAMILISVFLLLFIIPFKTVYLRRYEAILLIMMYLLYVYMVFMA